MRHILRLIIIQRVLFRYRLDRIILASPLLRILRWFLLLLPWNWVRPPAALPVAECYRCALEELGPIFVKCGQLLSTRRDVLSEEFAEEFSKLQNRVPPFPGALARQIVEKAYECSLSEVFLEFDEVPLASASIAQVHAAKLLDGRECIVKVVRPDIEISIRRDMNLICFVAKQIERYYPEGRILRFTRVVKELEKTLLNELDIKREAANASQLRRNFQDEPRYYVPEINWELTRENVLVMERVSGIPMNDIDALKRAKVDLVWLAEFSSQIFFTQVFRDNYFHADMHPGNVFVRPARDGKPSQMAVVDFGIMSSLTEFDQRYLAENFMAFLNRDYQRVAELHLESGWVPTDTRPDELEFAVRTVCEPLVDRPVREISFGELLRRLFNIAQHFHVEIMPQLILLQKTIINVEGIGRQLDPELDIWRTARPQLEIWMKQRTGLRSLLKSAAVNFPHWGDRIPQLPSKIIDLVERLRDGKIEMVFKSEDVHKLRQELRFYYRRAICAILGAALLLCAALIYGIANDSLPTLFGAPIISLFGGALGVVLFVAALKDNDEEY